MGYHWRYLDTVDEARARLADNPAQLMTGFWLDQTPPPEWWWREDASGGQVVEQATHIIDLARFLAGDVTEVFGLSSHRDRGDFPGLTVPTATSVRNMPVKLLWDNRTVINNHLARARGGKVDHRDITVLAEAPRIGKHREEIRARIAAIEALERRWQIPPG